MILSTNIINSFLVPKVVTIIYVTRDRNSVAFLSRDVVFIDTILMVLLRRLKGNFEKSRFQKCLVNTVFLK